MFTPTDQDGNFRVGRLFNVEQSNRFPASLNTSAFSLAGLQELPQVLLDLVKVEQQLMNLVQTVRLVLISTALFRLRRLLLHTSIHRLVVEVAP